MNKNLLKKCIAELEKEKPNIDYLRGMLETLYEIQEPSAIITNKNPVSPVPPASNESFSEAEILEKEAKARLNNITNVAIET
jgi:hypothetical protein